MLRGLQPFWRIGHESARRGRSIIATFPNILEPSKILFREIKTQISRDMWPNIRQSHEERTTMLFIREMHFERHFKGAGTALHTVRNISRQITVMDTSRSTQSFSRRDLSRARLGNNLHGISDIDANISKTVGSRTYIKYTAGGSRCDGPSSSLWATSRKWIISWLVSRRVFIMAAIAFGTGLGISSVAYADLSLWMPL